MQDFNTPDHPALRILEPGEQPQAITPALNADMLVTDRRIAVVSGTRVALDIPYEQLRRVQFDIERDRPATLVLVPQQATDEPQVLVIPVEAYREAAKALAVVGEKLHELG